MSEFLAGVSKAKTLLDVIEFCERAIPRVNEMLKDNHNTKAFFEAIQKQDPMAQSVNSQNTAFYETTGVGAKGIQEQLHKYNIPNIAVEMHDGGRTVIAVPKQYAAQANQILGQTAIINDTHEGKTGEQLPTEQQEFLKRVSTNKEGTPSPVATRGLTSGQVEAMELSHGAALGMQARLQREGIPSTSFTNTQTGKTTVCFDKIYTAQAQNMYRELERTPTELGRNEFMKKNLGQPIVERSGITEAQIRHIRSELMGSGLQYNAERHDNGTYTVRFPQKDGALIAPTMIRAAIETNGRNAQAMESHAGHITNTAYTVAEKAADGKSCYVVDAQNPQNSFTIDKTGMRDAQGKLIVGRQSQNFEAHVYAATMKMEAPLVKDGDKFNGKAMEDVFTREEIVAAREGAALANPDQASVLAGQIACLAVQPQLSAPNADIAAVINDSAAITKTLADGIEEECYRYGPEELKDLTHLPGNTTPECVEKYINTINNMSPVARVNHADALNRTADSITEHTASRNVGKQDVSLQDIGREMDARDQGREIEMPAREADMPSFDDAEPVIGVSDD